MTVLALLRHAKAIKDDPGGDHARALSETGRAAAAVVGERLSRSLPSDVQVFASDARRTRQTAELAFPSHAGLRLHFEPALYAASLKSLMAFVRQLPADVSAAVMVGHNPGLSELALALAGDGDPADLARLAGGLATADAVVLDLVDGWAGAGPRSGRVISVLARKEAED